MNNFAINVLGTNLKQNEVGVFFLGQAGFLFFFRNRQLFRWMFHEGDLPNAYQHPCQDE